jgi:hypothetical protein
MLTSLASNATPFVDVRNGLTLAQAIVADNLKRTRGRIQPSRKWPNAASG